MWFQHKKFKNIIRYSYNVFHCDYEKNFTMIKSQVTSGLDHIGQLNRDQNSAYAWDLISGSIS